MYVETGTGLSTELGTHTGLEPWSGTQLRLGKYKAEARYRVVRRDRHRVKYRVRDTYRTRTMVWYTAKAREVQGRG